jgi:polar amino acid transport system substrate-binding protein
MRRWLMILVAALALALVAAGCGGDDEETTPAETDAQGETFTTVTEGTLTVGSDIPFPPFEFREGGELTGFDVDLVEEMASRLDLEVEWVDTAFDTIFTQLAAGRFDMVASATTITEERQQQVEFTEPYYAAQQAMTVNPQQTPDLQTTDDLSDGDTVAVQRGTTGETWARENLEDQGVQVRSFPEAPDTYTSLEGGNVTAVIFDEPSAVSEAAERENLEVVQTIDTGERYGFPVDPRNEELLTALNRVLGEIKEDGTYEEIYDRYEDLGDAGNILQAEDPETGEAEPTPEGEDEPGEAPDADAEDGGAAEGEAE